NEKSARSRSPYGGDRFDNRGFCDGIHAAIAARSRRRQQPSPPDRNCLPRIERGFASRNHLLRRLENRTLAHRQDQQGRPRIQGNRVPARPIVWLCVRASLFLPRFLTCGWRVSDGLDDPGAPGPVRQRKSWPDQRLVHRPFLRLYGNAHQHCSAAHSHTTNHRGPCNCYLRKVPPGAGLLFVGSGLYWVLSGPLIGWFSVLNPTEIHLSQMGLTLVLITGIACLVVGLWIIPTDFQELHKLFSRNDGWMFTIPIVLVVADIYFTLIGLSAGNWE